MCLLRFGLIGLAVFPMAILVASAQPALEQQKARGYLGVLVVPTGDGVLVRDVVPDGPAAKSGVKNGDRIVKIANEAIRDVDKFLRVIAARSPGEKLTIVIVRDGKENELTATLSEQQNLQAGFGSLYPPGLRRTAFLGVQSETLTSEIKKRMEVDAEGGAVVTEVVPNSPAAKAGVKRNDVITTVNDRSIKTSTDLLDAVQSAGPGKQIELQLVRGKKKLSVKATLQDGTVGVVPMPELLLPPAVRPPTIDPGRRLQELERRVEALEGRLRELEKK